MTDSTRIEAEAPRVAAPGAACLEALPLPGRILGGDGACLAVNGAWRAFTGTADGTGSPQAAWEAAVHPEDRRGVADALVEADRDGVPFHLEYRLRRADGSYRWVAEQELPGGRPARLAVALDIHERRLSETRALRMRLLYHALGEVNRVVARNLAPDVIFDVACRVAVNAGECVAAWAGLLEPHTRALQPLTAAGNLPGMSDADVLASLRQAAAMIRAGEAEGLVSQACREGHFILSGGLQEDPRMSPWRDLAVRFGIDASAVFPFMVRGQARGVLVLYARDLGAFDAEVVDLLDRVAEDIALALERFDQAQRRTEIEGRLRASERLFEDTLDTLHEAIAVLDEQGRVLGLNAAWSDFNDPGNPLVFGLGFGADYREVCVPLLGRGDALEEAALGILEVMDGGRDAFTLDYPSSGAASPRWFTATVSRFSNEGHPRVVVAHREVTEQKRAEEALRESETLFRLITENAQDLILLADVEGRRLYYSPSYFTNLGYTREELDRQSPLELVHPEDRDQVRDGMRSIHEGRAATASLEYRLRKKDGSWSTYEARQVGIPALPGQPFRVLVIARDISRRREDELERRRMEIELHHAQKLESIGRLAAGIAHEINTPTQYIGDNLRFLQECLPGIFEVAARVGPGADPAALARELAERDFTFLQEEVPKAIQQSQEGVARVSKIVGAMKEFSHPGGEEMTLSDLNRAIESTVTVCRNEWKYVANVVMELDPALPPVPCLPGEINQVVLNLMVNAAHAIGDVVGQSGGKGRIAVRTFREEGMAVIQVEDTGCGIPDAIRDRIFDPFFTTKGVGKGSGQGLSIAHAVVVEKHGGALQFDSEEGKGTTFTIRLPLATKHAGGVR